MIYTLDEPTWLYELYTIGQNPQTPQEAQDKEDDTGHEQGTPTNTTELNAITRAKYKYAPK